MAKTTKNTKTNPDVIVDVSITAVFDKVFGTREKPNDAAAQKAAIQALSLDEAVAFCAYVGRRVQEFSDIFAQGADNTNHAPVTDFPKEETLFAVRNTDTGEMIGGVSVKTETKTTYSTANANGRQQVLDALDKAGITNQYTKTTIEVDNKKLAADKKSGVLSPSVADVFSENVSTKRVTTFQKLASETIEEKK